jgi:2-amino-4-hydroxy-6-hydroxymethyldihydropteridine diphosphokinase
VGTATYLIAIGSNRARARSTVAALCSPAKAGAQPHGRVWTPAFAGELLMASRIHISRPIGPGTRNYANAVVMIESKHRPDALLKRLKQIERTAGRRPGRRWGDRPLDLDIIAWSGGIWASPGLTIPHAEFRKRRFVLAPLCEIAPDWRDPVTHLTARHLLARLDRKRVRE